MSSSPSGSILFEGKCLRSNSFLKAVSFEGNHSFVSALSPEMLFYPEGNQQKLKSSCYLSFENFFKEEKNRKKRFSIGFNIELLSPNNETIYNYEISEGKIMFHRFSSGNPDWGVKAMCCTTIFKKECRNLARIRMSIYSFTEDGVGPMFDTKVIRSSTGVPAFCVMAIEDDIELVYNSTSSFEGGLLNFILKKVVVSSFRFAIDKIGFS